MTRGSDPTNQSTLLKALGGLLRQDSGHHMEGSVTYNGDKKESGKFSLPKVAHFTEQVGPSAFFLLPVQDQRCHRGFS